MFGIIALSLSLLVILAGMALLAKTKKDSLGNVYVFSSYAAIVLGLLMFLGGLVGGMCMMRCHKGGAASCYVQGGGHGCQQSACSQGAMSCGHQGGKCMAACKMHGAAGMKSCHKDKHHMHEGHHKMSEGKGHMNVKVEVEKEDDDEEDDE